MALFTSIRAAFSFPPSHQRRPEVRERWGFIVWITIPGTGERHRVLMSTGSGPCETQNRNISLALTGHNITTLSAADWPRDQQDNLLPNWRRFPREVAQNAINRICKRYGGQLVADALRQATIAGPVLNPQYLGRN